MTIKEKRKGDVTSEWVVRESLNAKQHLKQDLNDEKPDIIKIRGRHSLGRRKIRCRKKTKEGVALDDLGLQKRPVWLEHSEYKKRGMRVHIGEVGKG